MSGLYGVFADVEVKDEKMLCGLTEECVIGVMRYKLPSSDAKYIFL